MNSSTSTFRSTTPDSVTGDTSTTMCSPGREVAHPLPSLPPPSPDFEHANLLPSRPADLLITTRDLTVLLAHQAMLAFASDKLANLLEFDQPARLRSIHLDQSSGAVRTMLEWIYPHTSMSVGNFDALDAALAISKAYDLGAMHDALRGLLDQPNSPVHISVDPIRAYSLATTHGFTSYAQEAARLAIGKVDFRKEGLLEEFKTRGVSVECAFRLGQRQFAWESALADILLRTSVPSDKMVLTEEESQVLVCGECASCALGREEAEGPLGMVGWQRIWAERVYERLICTPLDECTYLFRPGYIARIWGEGCERCMVRLMGNQDMLDDWMSRVIHFAAAYIISEGSTQAISRCTLVDTVSDNELAFVLNNAGSQHPTEAINAHARSASSTFRHRVVSVAFAINIFAARDASDDGALATATGQAGRSGLVRGGSLREAGGRRGKHGASASVVVGGAGEGALERAQKEVLERKRMSASSLGTGSEDQPVPVLTLAEKHKDLLHFIAQKESKCVELRAQLAAHEADLLQLKKKWEKIVAKGNGQGRASDSHTGLGLGRLDATGAVDLVRGIFGGLGELTAPSASATPVTPSSSSSVSTPNHVSSPLPSAKPALATKPTASKGHLAHTPQSSSSSTSTALSSATTATRLSLSSASSLGGAEQLKEAKETAEPVGEDEDLDAWGPFESVQTEEPESAGALGLSGVEDKATEKSGSATNEQSQSWVPTAVGKKWEELRGTETYAKSTKRASTLLSDVSSAFTTTLNALAPPPTPSLTRSGTVGGISPRPSPSIKLTTAKPKPSTPSKPPPAPISTSARPSSATTPARPVSLLDDDDGNESAGLGAVLQPSPSVSARSKLSDPGSGKMGSDTFGEDWNW